jgi:tetratricopeptide (TPR) repeat protein
LSSIIAFGSLFFIIYTNFKLISRDIFLVKFFFITSYLSFPIAVGFLQVGCFDFLRKKEFSHRVGIILPALIALLPFISNYWVDDRSHNFITNDYGRSINLTLPKDSIFFIDRDMEVFTLYLSQLVEGFRKDVTLYDRSGILRKDLYAKDLLTLPSNERDRVQDQAESELMNKTFTTTDTNSRQEIYYSPPRDMNTIPSYKLVPDGLAFKVDLVSTQEIPSYNINYSLVRGLDDTHVFKDYTTRAIVMIFYKQLGDYFCYYDDTDKGFAYYDKASKVADDIEIMHSYLGQTYTDIGQYDRAVKEHKILTEMDENSHVYHYNLGLAYLNLNKNKEAKEELSKAVELNPDFYIAYFQLGKIFEKEENFEEAIKYYQLVTQVNPRYPDAYNSLATMLMKTKDFDKAIDYLRHVLSFVPKYPEAIFNLGLAYESKDMIEAALEQYENACKLTEMVRDNVPEFMKKACEKSIELSKSVKGNAPEIPANNAKPLNQTDMMMQNAQILTNAGKYDQAVAIFNQIISSDPNNKEAYNFLGHVYDMQGKTEDANKMYQKAIEIDPKFASAYNNLGASYANQKKYKQAKECWEKALKLDPSMIQAKGNLDQLNGLGLGNEN